MMRKCAVFACVLTALACLVLSGCAGENTPQAGSEENDYPVTQGLNKPVEQVGQVPQAFQSIVKNNVFNGVEAFEKTILKQETVAQDKQSRTSTYRVQLMDLYGTPLGSYTCSAEDCYYISTLTATDDGGFLFVLGFQDKAYPEGGWASEKPYASHVIKCDRSGNLQFDTSLEGIEGMTLRFCFEKNGKFYFFGERETPETNVGGIYSPTDVCMTVLDENGAVLKTGCIAGTDYDDLWSVKVSEEGFILSVRSQSDDGDFAESNSGGYGVQWTITVNDELQIIEKERDDALPSLDNRIGEENGVFVYADDARLENFDAGAPQVFLDYGDFYLIVSTNRTGIYEKTPTYISSIWYYTESVYSAYDHDGELIFRASVDSTPDYDALIK